MTYTMHDFCHDNIAPEDLVELDKLGWEMRREKDIKKVWYDENGIRVDSIPEADFYNVDPSSPDQDLCRLGITAIYKCDDCEMAYDASDAPDCCAKCGSPLGLEMSAAEALTLLGEDRA